MQLTRLLSSGILPCLVSARAAHVLRAVDCGFSTSPDSGATCASFASSWGLSVDELTSLNPSITCPGIDTSKSYCVIGTIIADPTTTATTTTATQSTTTLKTSTTTSSAPSNSPTMPGLDSNCDGFYLVSSGDQCGTIASKYGISVAQFLSWNSEVNTDCTNLWLGYYVCVHVPGATTTSESSPQPTSGPTPQMPGIIASCKSFYQVQSGDNCWSIYTNAGITFDQFLSWNTAVDSSCSNLWLGYYVCIGV